MGNSCKKSRLVPAFKILVFFLILISFLAACNDGHVDVSSQELVDKPEQINARAEDVIQGTLKDIIHKKSTGLDSFHIQSPEILLHLYQQQSFQPLWSSSGVFTPNGDSLFAFLSTTRYYGLFPEDYYFSRIASLKTQLITDTSKEKKLDASLWAYTDLLLTSAFVQVVKDLKVGRILPDSIIAKDTTLTPDFFLAQLKIYQLLGNKQVFPQQLEPQHADYIKLKTALRSFLDSADFTPYTQVRADDSTQLRRLVYQRMREEDSTLPPNIIPDSSELTKAIRSYQKSKGLKIDGKLTTALITKLNDTDTEKFIRIAINMDRYKQLPPLPSQYIWVNLPAYYLQLRDSDTIALKSRVVIGKPKTRTPILTSAISDMITYPKWTIPESIIKTEILPGLKKDPGYTISKGYSLVDTGGNEIDPYTINWSKYKNSIPYKVVQGSGDDNALGVLKFNFPNKFAVYLHDTNQRYLFSRSSRALSHGCVRVQAWKDLARYILRNDSLNSVNAVPVDSMVTWLEMKQRRYIPVRKPIPLFIRYFTCDASEGKLSFYEDVYGEDKKLRDLLLAHN